MIYQIIFLLSIVVSMARTLPIERRLTFVRTVSDSGNGQRNGVQVRTSASFPFSTTYMRFRQHIHFTVNFRAGPCNTQMRIYRFSGLHHSNGTRLQTQTLYEIGCTTRQEGCIQRVRDVLYRQFETPQHGTIAYDCAEVSQTTSKKITLPAPEKLISLNIAERRDS